MKLEAALNPSRSLRRGWAFLARAPVLLFLVTGGVVVTEIVGRYGRDSAAEVFFWRLVQGLPLAEYSSRIWDAEPQPLSWLPLLVPILLLLLWFRSLLEAGSFGMHRQLLKTASGDMAGLASGMSRARRLFVFHLLSWSLLLGSFALSALPGILICWAGVGFGSPVLTAAGMATFLLISVPTWITVSLGLYPGSRLLVFEDLSPVEALEQSWQLASGHRGALLIFRLVCVAFKMMGVIAGLLACGVGALITWPVFRAVSDAALSEALLLHRKKGEEQEEWRLLAELGEIQSGSGSGEPLVERDSLR